MVNNTTDLHFAGRICILLKIAKRAGFGEVVVCTFRQVAEQNGIRIAIAGDHRRAIRADRIHAILFLDQDKITSQGLRRGKSGLSQFSLTPVLVEKGVGTELVGDGSRTSLEINRSDRGIIQQRPIGHDTCTADFFAFFLSYLGDVEILIISCTGSSICRQVFKGKLPTHFFRYLFLTQQNGLIVQGRINANRNRLRQDIAIAPILCHRQIGIWQCVRTNTGVVEVNVVFAFLKLEHQKHGTNIVYRRNNSSIFIRYISIWRPIPRQAICFFCTVGVVALSIHITAPI